MEPKKVKKLTTFINSRVVTNAWRDAYNEMIEVSKKNHKDFSEEQLIGTIKKYGVVKFVEAHTKTEDKPIYRNWLLNAAMHVYFNM